MAVSVVDKFRFLSEPDDALKCLICSEVAEEPWQEDECGRLFSRKCLDEYGKDKPCPNCRAEEPRYFAHNKGRKEIQALYWTCDCMQFSPISFSGDDALKCLICLEVAEEPWQHDKCGRLFCKKCLDKHGKVKPCPNCREIQPQYFEDTRGKRDIQALRVKCSNFTRKCKWKGTVGTLEAHVSICEFTLIPCPKKCKTAVRLMRKYLDEHLEKDCPNRDHKCKHCGEKGAYAHMTKVHDSTCKMKIIPCPSANCTNTIQRRNVKRHLEECGYSEIPCKYQKIGCSVKMMRKDIPSHEDEDKIHLHMALNKVVTMKKEIVTMKKEIITMKNDIREIEVRVKTLRNGDSLTFELSDFQKKKADNARFYSGTFYSSPNGYHMQVKVNANGVGEGEGSHVSVHICILEGKHDAKLIWPFIGRVTFQVLNQLKDEDHFQSMLPIEWENDLVVGYRCGYSQFIPHPMLAHDLFKNTQYLKDDTLYFRVSVEVSDHKPWLECTAN